MTRRVGAAIGAAFVGLMLLSACGHSPSTEGGTGGTYEYVTVDTPHGPVECIIWDGIKAGNITCNWDNQ